MRGRSALLLAVAFAAGVVTGGVGARAVVRGAPPSPAASPRSSPSQAPELTPAVRAIAAREAELVTASEDELRSRIQASVAAAVAELRRGRELDVLLDEVEATARRQRQVTSDQVLAGLAAIDAAYPGDPERTTAFTRRMEAVAHELGQPANDDADDPGDLSAMSLIGAVAASPAGVARDRLVPRTLTAINRLPEGEQAEAFRALERATAPVP